MRSWIPLVILVSVGLAAVAAPVPKESQKLGPVTHEQLKHAAENLKQIGIALHAYHDTNRFLPNNLYTVDKKPLLSWRVAILPYLDQEDLYKKFKLDQPWDSEHNKKLIEEIPKVFAPVRAKSKQKGETFLQGFDGGNATFTAGVKPRIPASFPDGTSNTIALVESDEPVIWTKPADLQFDEKKDLPKMGGQFDGNFHVLCVNGAVHLVDGMKMDHVEFKRMVIPNDGYGIRKEIAFGHK